MDSTVLESAVRPVVAVVDDEPLVRSYLTSALTALGVELVQAGSVAEFRAVRDVRDVDCAIVDLRLPDGSGLDLAAELRSQGAWTSLILITGYASVRIAVQAVQGGMIDVLEKPFAPAEVLAAVERGLALCRERRRAAGHRQLARQRLARLTDSERMVLELVLAGAPNKAIARNLGLGLRTVESRKGQLYSKLQAESMAELIQAALAGGFEPQTARQGLASRPAVLAAG